MGLRQGLAAVVLALSACSSPQAGPDPRAAEGAAQDPPADDAEASDLNRFVLEVLREYPTDGTCGYHWPPPGSDPWEGTTQDVVYAGRRLTRGDPQRRSYCCGLTFEVYVRALLRANGGEPVPGVSADDLHELRLRFFGDSKTGERRRLAQYGLESLGLGRAVTDLAQARPGDFVQLWRHSGSGHSAIFIEWQRDGERLTGITYWSSQPSTKGIGYNTETIGPKGVDAAQIYLGRASWPVRK